MSDINKAVFKETLRMCKSDSFLRESIEFSREHQKVYTEVQNIDLSNHEKYAESADIQFSSKRTFQAARDLARTYDKVCVLNFASAMNPGGGVFNGANAQEESLCRASTLYECISDDKVYKRFYEVHRKECKSAVYNSDCIYTPNVVVFCMDNYYNYLLLRDNWWSCNVISCAAPNLRKVPSNEYNNVGNEKRAIINNDELYKIQYERLSRIFQVAIANDNECIVVGAFGCGAFRNPAFVVANALADVIEVYKNYFKVIEIAVPNIGRSKSNYDIFAKKFK